MMSNWLLAPADVYLACAGGYTSAQNAPCAATDLGMVWVYACVS